MSEQLPGTCVAGSTHDGRTCRLRDSTGTVSEGQLRDLLSALIAERRFDRRWRSLGAGQTIPLDQAEFGHVQLGDRLYRLIVRRDEARLEVF